MEAVFILNSLLHMKKVKKIVVSNYYFNCYANLYAPMLENTSLI